MSIRIITTEDGSHSLFDEQLNETYHSTRGARGESTHVFIKEGLEHRLKDNKADAIRILEVGLGTGLNAFLTAKYSMAHQQKIHLTTLEPFPIQAEIYDKLNYHQTGEEKDLLNQIHTSVWEEEVNVSGFFTLFKTTAKLESFANPHRFDVIYFDAFAPSKQPEVWSLANLKTCFAMLEPGGVLTTYCAQGQFKRDLKEAGFLVETLQGAMGKKEMVRAIK